MNDIVYISSFHKSGTHLIQKIFNSTNINYKYVNGFHIPDRALRKKKGWFNSISNKKIVIIRNPIEMLVSSYRYIPTTTETWVDKKFKKHNYKSFRERYNSLDKVGRIRLCSEFMDKTFVGMYDTYGQNNVLYIKLENFYNDKSTLEELKKIEDYLDCKLDIPHLLSICRTKYNSTTSKKEYTYQDVLTLEQIETFNKRYGYVISKLGYNED